MTSREQAGVTLDRHFSRLVATAVVALFICSAHPTRAAAQDANQTIDQPALTTTPQTQAAPAPWMSLDVPATGSSVAGVFAVAGWALDLGAADGTGVSTIHVWAFPTSGGSPIFLGATQPGVSRPDVGLIFGERFSSSGFGMTAGLSPGAYVLVAYAFSTVTGTFNDARTAHVTVVAPPSIPGMAVDLPAANQGVGETFAVAGWALDRGAHSGTGVDAIHVWAYPLWGGDPLFVGATTPGVWRPDVAAAFGETRFGHAGYALEGHLPPGHYGLVVYAFSVVARTFNNAVLVRIHVGTPPSEVPADPPPPPNLPRLVVFNASADHDANVTSYAVEFFVAGTNPAGAAPVLVQHVGKLSPVHGEIVVDVTASVQALPPGWYVVTVSASGHGGTTRSAPTEPFAR